MQQELKVTLQETRHLPIVAALVLMVVGLGVTWLAHRQVELSIRNESAARFNEQFERVHASVQAQFEQPVRGLDGLKGLFAAVGQVKPQQFRAWVQSQDILQNYAGAQGFGYLERGSNNAPYQLRYLEPRPQNLRDWELQLQTDPSLREAAIRSVNGDAASLVRMPMVGKSTSLRADFLLMAPIFRTATPPIDAQERREVLQGILFTPVLAEELLTATLAVTEGMLNFEITDEPSPNQQVLLFSSSNPIHADSKREAPHDFNLRPFSKSRKLVIGGHRMRLQAGSSPLFESQLDRATPVLIATAGSVLSLMLAIIFWLVLQGRERARSMAHSMTKDLGRLARVVKSTSHIVILGDKNRNITWVNDAFTQFTQMPLDKVVGINFAELFRLDDTDPVSRAQFREAMDKREGVRMQMPWRTADGQQHWLDVNLQTELGAGGEFAGYIAIASDSTAQRNANDQITAALQENRQLMDAIDQHSIVSITDHQGRITYVNNMFCEVSGYSEAELLGANHRIVKSAYQNDAFWESMWKTISSGYPWRATVCNQAKDGRLYWVDSVVAPFFDEGGNIEKYVSIRTDVTPARTAQLALANEREHLAAILDGTDAGTWEWDVPKGVLVINDRWAGMLGYTPQSLGTVTVKKWRSLCHPEDLPRVQALGEAHLSGESTSFSCEIRMQHQEGHWVWILLRGKVTTWIAPGKPHWISGIHIDISPQKILESELQQKNMLMESILSNIPVALSVFNSDLNLIAKNDKFLELLEFPKWLFERPTVTFESLIRFNGTRGEYGSGDVEHAVQSIIERARHTVAHQFERVRPNGLALEVRGAPMPGGGFITTYADISARKQAQAAIVESQRLLQSVLDAASEVAIISLGGDGLITLFNKGAEHLLGYSPDEIVGKMTPAAFFDTAELQARASALSAQLGKPMAGLEVLIDDHVLGKRTEWQLVHKGGYQFTAAIVMTAMTNDAGERTGYLGVSHDVTQEKKNEQALQMAVTLAEQAALSKGQFLANMSHEIRTPMNAILGMLKLLQNTELDSRQQDYASKTETAARSLLGLLNDILDFSKAEAGKMTLDPQPFALDQIMRDLSVILSANIGTKDIEILFDIDPAIPPSLLGDSLRLQQVLINLAGNAIKFTQHGEVLLSVSLVDTAQGLAHIQFKVRDSGIGIAPENQQHIFSGFSQAEASTTRRFGGTGLGLAISQRLVAMMGGTLDLTSVLGQGSTFFFTVALPTDATHAPHTPIASGTTHAGAKPTLVVDDNPIARDILARMAQAQGWQVDVASSAEEALACLQSRQQNGLPSYEVVLMDWHMPGMDGWEAAQMLRASERGPALPVVLMVTAHQREQLSYRSEMEQRSLDGFLVKPITASMLVEAVTDAQSSAHNPTRRAPTKLRKAKQLTGMRILVVEDNPINQQVAKELLRTEGALVEIADNGELGVEAVRLARPPYDVVLMDLQMPVMDGYTASVEIRHTLGLTDLPIIAMTANAMASDRETCLAAGMNDHIGKPFDLPKLVALLLQHTQYQPFEDAEAAPDTPADQPALAAQDEAIAQALERLGGNQALFTQIVHAFLTEIATLGQQFDTLLASHDAGDLARVLHTYKGLSLTVGANALSEACASAETAFKAVLSSQELQDPAKFADLRARILDAVAQTTSMLGTVIAPMEPAQVKNVASLGKADPLALAHDLQSLLPLLRSSNLQVLDNFKHLLGVYGALDTLVPLQSAIATFDFGTAVVQCETLVQQLQHPATL